jgi:hypothetical protein
MAKKSKIEHVADKDICSSIRQHTSAYVSIRQDTFKKRKIEHVTDNNILIVHF